MSNSDAIINDLSSRPSSEIVDWMISNVSMQQILQAVKNIDANSYHIMVNELDATENFRANQGGSGYTAVYPPSQPVLANSDFVEGETGASVNPAPAPAARRQPAPAPAPAARRQPAPGRAGAISERARMLLMDDGTLVSDYPQPNMDQRLKFNELENKYPTGTKFDSSKEWKKRRKFLEKNLAATPKQITAMKDYIKLMVDTYSVTIPGDLQGPHKELVGFPAFVIPIPLKNLNVKHNTGDPKVAPLSNEVQTHPFAPIGVIQYKHVHHDYATSKGQIAIMSRNAMNQIDIIADKNRKARKHGKKSYYDIYQEELAKVDGTNIRNQAVGGIISINSSQAHKAYEVKDAKGNVVGQKPEEYIVDNDSQIITAYRNAEGKVPKSYSFLVNGVYYQDFPIQDLLLDYTKMFGIPKERNTATLAAWTGNGFGRPLGITSRPSYDMSQRIPRSAFGDSTQEAAARVNVYLLGGRKFPRAYFGTAYDAGSESWGPLGWFSKAELDARARGWSCGPVDPASFDELSDLFIPDDEPVEFVYRPLDPQDFVCRRMASSFGRATVSFGRYAPVVKKTKKNLSRPARVSGKSAFGSRGKITKLTNELAKHKRTLKKLEAEHSRKLKRAETVRRQGVALSAKLRGLRTAAARKKRAASVDRANDAKADAYDVKKKISATKKDIRDTKRKLDTARG